MHDCRVTVWTIRVNHGSIPSVGYRIKTVDLDVAFSGDRGTQGDHLDRWIKDPDVLLHEIIDTAVVIPTLKRQHATASRPDHQEHDHSPPELVARTATTARAKRLVLYHLIPGNAALSDQHWESLIRPGYLGEVIVGRDLLELAPRPPVRGAPHRSCVGPRSRGSIAGSAQLGRGDGVERGGGDEIDSPRDPSRKDQVPSRVS